MTSVATREVLAAAQKTAQKFGGVDSGPTKLSQFKNEIFAYLNFMDGAEGQHDDLKDPLTLWGSSAPRFPILARFARSAARVQKFAILTTDMLLVYTKNYKDLLDADDERADPDYGAEDDVDMEEDEEEDNEEEKENEENEDS